MTAASTTSYRPEDGFGGLVGELERLERQAALTWDVEMAAWRAAGLTEDGMILDLGCGSGAVTERLRAARPRATVVGTDVDEALLGGVEPPVVRIVDGRVDLPDGIVDDIVVRYVVQHLDAPARARLLGEAARLLRPRGRLHVVDVLDADWGQIHPAAPGLARIYRRVAEHQAGQGGNRSIVAVLPDELAAAGFGPPQVHRALVTSDDKPVADFEVHLGPRRYVPLVSEGVLGSLDLARIAWAWHAVLTCPDAYVALAVHVLSAARHPAPTPEGPHR
jgi:SAM-dependent methyltransferase